MAMHWQRWNSSSLDETLASETLKVQQASRTSRRHSGNSVGGEETGGYTVRPYSVATDVTLRFTAARGRDRRDPMIGCTARAGDSGPQSPADGTRRPGPGH
eukprot:768120-Hanusia_phi.AAC.4